jgi:hypothetical protein
VLNDRTGAVCEEGRPSVYSGSTPEIEIVRASPKRTGQTDGIVAFPKFLDPKDLESKSLRKSGGREGFILARTLLINK